MDLDIQEEQRRAVREKYRLTDREKMIVMGVATICFIVLCIWLLTIILMLPNPSQGI